MANENTVTIPLEEYFDLRQKAEMNGFLMAELGRINERFIRYEEMLYRLEDKVRDMKDGK